MLSRHSTGAFAATSAPDGFGVQELEEFGLKAVERKFSPKDLIFAPDDPDDKLYFLISGTIRLYKFYGDYKEATLALLKDSGIFGKMSLVEGRWQEAFAEAVTEVRVAGVQKSSIEWAIKNRPDFALKLFSALSERLRQSDEVIESLLHREVSTRLATLLLNLSDRHGEGDNGAPRLDVRLTHQDLASMIASTREAVSKVMSEFQREGVIRVEKRQIVISDRDRLQEYASGPAYL